MNFSVFLLIALITVFAGKQRPRIILLKQRRKDLRVMITLGRDHPQSTRVITTQKVAMTTVIGIKTIGKDLLPSRISLISDMYSDVINCRQYVSSEELDVCGFSS